MRALLRRWALLRCSILRPMVLDMKKNPIPEWRGPARPAPSSVLDATGARTRRNALPFVPEDGLSGPNGPFQSTYTNSFKLKRT
jgi:hypothetical protein